MATSPDNLTLYRYKRTNKGYTEDLGEGVSLTLMLIPAGEFMMGASEGEPEIDDRESPQHRVELPQFLMGRYPVTQSQWRIVASYGREDMDLDPDPAHFKGDELPVEQVSWYQAAEFCNRLAKRTGKNYHLPSEAQWEYGCRAETETVYHFGPKLTEELANYNPTEGQTTPVGQYPANPWGLHDMHGNVWEWCHDHWHNNYKSAPTDGSAWLSDNDKARRVNRGGSWDLNPRYCRSAYRSNDEPGNDLNHVGFRVVCSALRTLQPPTG
jgi:formylglycine-generating enzyme required for sulfatase activity